MPRQHPNLLFIFTVELGQSWSSLGEAYGFSNAHVLSQRSTR